MTVDLKQNMLWLRMLGSFMDESCFITSVDVQTRGDTLTISLVARQKDRDKVKTSATARHLQKSLNKWQRKMNQTNDRDSPTEIE